MTVLIAVRKGCRITDPRVRDKVEKAVQSVLDQKGLAAAEVSLSIVPDEEIRRLNLDYRGMDRPTDVLAFPLYEKSELRPTMPPEALPPQEGLSAPSFQPWVPAGPFAGEGEPLVLGDVIISLARAEHQADLYGHNLARELCFLAVHGTLHLLGYDHDSPDSAEAMTAATEAVLERLGLGR